MLLSGNGSQTITVTKGTLIIMCILVGGGPYPNQWTVTNAREVIYGPLKNASDYPFGAIFEATGTSCTITSTTGVRTNILLVSP